MIITTKADWAVFNDYLPTTSRFSDFSGGTSYQFYQNSASELAIIRQVGSSWEFLTSAAIDFRNCKPDVLEKTIEAYCKIYPDNSGRLIYDPREDKIIYDIGLGRTSGSWGAIPAIKLQYALIVETYAKKQTKVYAGSGMDTAFFIHTYSRNFRVDPEKVPTSFQYSFLMEIIAKYYGLNIPGTYIVQGARTVMRPRSTTETKLNDKYYQALYKFSAKTMKRVRITSNKEGEENPSDNLNVVTDSIFDDSGFVELSELLESPVIPDDLEYCYVNMDIPVTGVDFIDIVKGRLKVHAKPEKYSEISIQLDMDFDLVPTEDK